jgi:catechol 2,3-dioxygenase-like lactoylglutathione lyase family enzyme
VTSAPAGFESNGLWVSDPHGMLIHLQERAADPELAAGPNFEINAPGRLVRTRRSAMLPSAACAPARPLRLGHILLFSPDVMRSVAFVTEALGMGLADRSQDVIAFCCARRDSEHHVVAFAKSPAVGFHHASFQVGDPDEVGRGGRERPLNGDWGFGRHTIGSNFFHYIQDPWGSWFEYYSDMDHIDDYALWTPTNYAIEDSLANWGPAVPPDFVHNYEAQTTGSVGAA